ncbi:polysaccharide lyase [Myxococcota bacterium]|nr:polysaccharide lyase [Myxococcota bacterium]MBU1381720.1 polysaccharide lyase [Myxococcota bacterium]MBU1497473.1 polysaccharide lyase [Myxococcota bacterium]
MIKLRVETKTHFSASRFGSCLVAVFLFALVSCGKDKDKNATYMPEGTTSTLTGIDTRDLGFANLATPTVISSFDTPEWGAGTIDENLLVEGSGSLRWEHALDADGCFEYGGNTFCYLRLEYENTPLDLSDKEFISMWIHNDTRSGFNETYHETYEEIVNDFIYLNFIYEGGSYDALIRLDQVGWRQFAMEKRSFGGSENATGWGAITAVHMFVSNSRRPITERVVHLDYMIATDLPPGNIPARWLSTFESGSFDPDIGSRLVLGQHVFDEENNISQYRLEYTTVVENPVPSSRNPSARVFKSHVPQQGYIRAEYEANSVATEGQTHIYAWKEYLPSSTFDNIDFYWLSLGQWKTYPCGEYGGWGENICGGGGIFNDRDIQLDPDPDELRLRFRAEPDCFEPTHVFEKDVWTSYAMEVFWTNTDTGYYRLFKNGELVFERSGIKTLLDNFQTGTCDMKWAMGIYSNWWSTAGDDVELVYYLDDMAIFDRAHGVTIEEVINWQAGE